MPFGYEDPKTKVRYPSKEWMFANWATLPEVQKAYPERGEDSFPIQKAASAAKPTVTGDPNAPGVVKMTVYDSAGTQHEHYGTMEQNEAWRQKMGYTFEQPAVTPTAPEGGAALPFPQTQAEMDEYQARQARGEIEFDGTNWVETGAAEGILAPTMEHEFEGMTPDEIKAEIEKRIKNIAEQIQTLQDRVETEGITAETIQEMIDTSEQSTEIIINYPEMSDEEKENLRLQNNLLNLQLQDIQNRLDSPNETEREEAKKEAEEYFGYILPTGDAPFRYPEMKAEIEARATQLEKRAEEDYEFQKEEIEADKQRLVREYKQYLEDIETGKIRIGEDVERTEARRLAEQREFVEQHEFTVKQNVEALHRGWLGRGALVAGPRFEAARTYGTEAEMAKERYLTAGEARGRETEVTYQRAMEDYLKRGGRAGVTQQAQLTELQRRTGQYEALKTRGVEDIALARIQDIRGLQEKYQTAIGARMAERLGEKYYG